MLERCQIRRVRTKGTLQVPFTYVLKHLERWGLLGKEVLLQDLAPVLIMAKQDTTDPYRCVERKKAACQSSLRTLAAYVHTGEGEYVVAV